MIWARNALPIALLGLFALLAVSSMARMSVTGDEVTHLPSGYTYVATGDFRLNMQHPPLIKMLAGLPLLALDLKPVESGPGWNQGREWLFGKDFLTNNREPMARIVFLARLPMVAVGLLLGTVLFLWARELWGFGPALFVLFLFALCPNLLAHSPIVHTDVGVACFSLLTVYMLWKFARSAHLGWALACGIALGLALLAKYSGVVTVGVVGALLLVLLVRAAFARRVAGGEGDGVGTANEGIEVGQPPPSPLLGKEGEGIDPPSLPRRGSGGGSEPLRPIPPPSSASPNARTIVLAGLIIFSAATLLVAAGFGFPHGLTNYYRGFTMIHADANPHWEAFLWGRYSKDGFWYYYLLAQLWKMPLPALLCFGAALLLAPLREKSTRLDWCFLLLPPAAFHAAGMWKSASIGVRHVLPAFPFVFLCCGATAWWVGRRSLRHKAVFAALCLWYATGTLRVYPHFLPYFNELAGGPDGGVRYLDDSNVEWGQSYYDLKRYLDETAPAKVRFLAFEPIDRSRYGIGADPMKLEDAVWPEPGVTYLVGASYLQRNSLFNDYPGVRLQWLDRYRPVDEVGWSIYVYRFSIDPADADDPSVFYIPAEEWYATAVASLNEILRRHPKFDYPREVLGRVTFEEARWREARGEIDSALVEYVDAVAIGGGGDGRHSDVRQAIERIAPRLSLDGTPAWADFRQASVDCQRGTYGRCVVTLLRTIAKDERHLAARLNLGSTYMQLGFPVLARREWESCLRIDPGYAPALDNLRRMEAGAGAGGNGS
jgi:tetratricopeptide (TPR) repeat protein